MRLLATYQIEGILRVLTGLHIGSGNQDLRIGGIDNPVIKTIDNKPYIPGSSLKGKMRSELEWKYDKVKKLADDILAHDYPKKLKELESKSIDEEEKIKKAKEIQVKVLSQVKACNCGECDICKLFGHTNTDKKRYMRAIFRDIYLSTNSKDVKTEAKSENTISRITSEATPRQIERVPVGTKFDLKIVVKTYEGDNIELLKLLFEGLCLVEDSFLGGGGSRGNGQVEFTDIKIFKQSLTDNTRAQLNIVENTASALFRNFDSIKPNL